MLGLSNYNRVNRNLILGNKELNFIEEIVGSKCFM